MAFTLPDGGRGSINQPLPSLVLKPAGSMAPVFRTTDALGASLGGLPILTGAGLMIPSAWGGVNDTFERTGGGTKNDQVLNTVFDALDRLSGIVKPASASAKVEAPQGSGGPDWMLIGILAVGAVAITYALAAK